MVAPGGSPWDWLQAPAFQQQGFSPEMMQQAGVTPTSRIQAIGQALMGFGQGVQHGGGGLLQGLAGGAVGAAGGWRGAQVQDRQQTLESLLQQAQIAKLMRPAGGASRPIVATPGSTVLDPNDPTKVLYQNPKSPTPENLSDQDKMIQALSGGDPAKAQGLYQQLFQDAIRPPVAPSVSVKVGGTSVTLPDTQPLTPANVTETQKGVMSIDDELAQLDTSLRDYKGVYSTLPEKVKQGALGVKEWLGQTLSPDEERARRDFVLSNAQIGQFSAERINKLYGAALSSAESSRANSFLPSDKDTPIEKQTKLEYARDTLKAGSLRKKLALAAGIDVSDAAELARAVGSVDEIQRDPASSVLKLAKQKFPGRGIDDPEVKAFVLKLTGELGG